MRGNKFTIHNSQFTIKHKLILILCIVHCALCIVFLSGCQSNTFPKARPISEYRLISVVGLDRGEKTPSGVSLTLSAKKQADSKLGGGKQGEGGGPDDKPLLLTNEARSFALAYQEMQTYTQDYLFLGHVRYFLLGEEAAREGIGRYLDFPARDPDGRFLARLYVVEGASARDLLNGSSNERFIADRLAAMESDVGVLSVAKYRNLTQTLDALEGSQGNFLLPILKTVSPEQHNETAKDSKQGNKGQETGDRALGTKDGQQKTKDKGEKTGDEGQSKEKEQPEVQDKTRKTVEITAYKPEEPGGKQTDLDIAGYAIMENGRMTGVIGKELSMAVNFLQNTVTYYVAETDAADGHTAALRILNSHSALTPHWDGDRLTGLNIRIQAEAALNEDQSGPPSGGAEDLRPLARQFDVWLEASLTSILTQAQGHGVDYLGLGARLERSHPVRYSRLDRDWNEVFADLPLTVEVETSVVRSYELN